MVIRMDRHAREILKQAGEEAGTAGSPAIEAEHLLLAMTSAPAAEAQRVLASAGLDHAAISAALDREVRQSLATAGVAVPADGFPQPSRLPARRVRFSASSKLVLQRALKAASGQRQIRPGHLLLGVLGAQAGTVPRALALAGVDRDELTARTREALAGQPR
jgi:ATP-dependent Clp protease ATP-binding subunit ClpA